VPVKASSVVAVTLGAIKPEDMEVLIVSRYGEQCKERTTMLTRRQQRRKQPPLP